MGGGRRARGRSVGLAGGVREMLGEGAAPEEREEAGGGATGFPMLPWSLLGMGLFIAWLCCTHLPGCFADARPGDGTRTLVDYVMRAGDIGTFVAVSFLGGRAWPISSHPRACVAACALLVVGSALCPLSSYALGPSALTAACALVAGVGGAALFLMWAEVYGQLGPTRLLLNAALSCLLAGACSLAIAHMDYVAACAAIVVVALLSALLAFVCLSRAPGERERSIAVPAAAAGDGGGRPGRGSAEAASPAAGVPWRLVAIMAVAGFVSGFAGSLFVAMDGVGAVHRIAATALFGAILLVPCLRGRTRFDVRWLAGVALPCSVAAFVVIPPFGWDHGMAVSFLLKFSYVMFTGFVLLDLCAVTYRFEIPSARLFAPARAASEGAILVGIVLRRQMAASGVLAETGTLWVITVVGLLGILACVVLWATERSVNADWAVMGIDMSDETRVPGRRERVLSACDALAAQHGLTQREAEILGMLAMGETPDQIENELFVSHNTFKTHARHIYAKLGVHTREEAVDLVLGARG